MQEITKIKEEHLEEQNDLMHLANEAQRENRILKTKCRELQHQVDEVEEDLQTTEEETLRMEVKFRKEQKILRRNSEILQNTARLKVCFHLLLVLKLQTTMFRYFNWNNDSKAPLKKNDSVETQDRNIC